MFLSVDCIVLVYCKRLTVNVLYALAAWAMSGLVETDTRRSRQDFGNAEHNLVHYWGQASAILNFHLHTVFNHETRYYFFNVFGLVHGNCFGFMSYLNSIPNQ